MISKYKNYLIEKTIWFFIVTTTAFLPLTATKLNLLGLLLYLIVIILMIKQKIFRKINFKSNFKKNLLPWTIMSSTMILGLIIAKTIFPNGLFKGFCQSYSCLLWNLPQYIFISSILQELVFRGYFFEKTKELFSTNKTIIISSLIFAYFHLSYIIQLKSELFYISIIAGIIWGIFYSKYPNMILAMLSHSIVGTITLLLLQKF